MLVEVLKAILLGFCAAAPFGPVAVFIFQRTLCYGQRGGMLSGLGSASVDTLYAVISLFAVSAIQSFIKSNEMWIMIAGGAVICCVGLRIASRNTIGRIARTDASISHVGGALKAAGCALANPGALALMLTLVSVFGMGQYGKLLIIADAVGVFSGEVLYWLLFTAIISKVGENIRPRSIRIACRVAGLLITVLGALLLIRGIIKL